MTDRLSELGGFNEQHEQESAGFAKSVSSLGYFNSNQFNSSNK